MPTLPQASPGHKIRLVLDENNRTTGGAFQIWHNDELLHQGSNYGGIPTNPAPDIWRPIGLVQRQELEFAIFLFVPTTAKVGTYELRLATTLGSRSAHFQVA
jgi:hypothetical protein